MGKESFFLTEFLWK